MIRHAQPLPTNEYTPDRIHCMTLPLLAIHRNSPTVFDNTDSRFTSGSAVLVLDDSLNTSAVLGDSLNTSAVLGDSLNTSAVLDDSLNTSDLMCLLQHLLTLEHSVTQ